MKGELILLPNVLGDSSQNIELLPSLLDKIVREIDGLIAESEKEGRRFLSRFLTREKAFSLPLLELSEHTKDMEELLSVLLKGERWGLISDAGLPILSDPGPELVSLARKRGITIKALMGPSAPILALMLSGLPSKHVCFYGYLSRKKERRVREIGLLEKQSFQQNMTYIFIETPYRNDILFSHLLHRLHPNTYLALALDLTMPTESVLVKRVYEWKKEKEFSLKGKRAVFLLYKQRID